VLWRTHRGASSERLLEEALGAGAWGLSSGLFTAPGNFADAAEIHALARVLRRHGAAYSTHMRDERDHVFDGRAPWPRGPAPGGYLTSALGVTIPPALRQRADHLIE
jgi:hypothetical protein